MTERQSQFLGILNRAGKIAFGQSAFGKGKKISLLLLAEDASELTQKGARSFAGKFGLKIESVKTKAELGKPFGYEAISLVAILDRKAAKAFLEKGAQQAGKELRNEEE
jgi:ribosomal protein L7Ae-like RNA K-turn-binding protein